MEVYRAKAKEYARLTILTKSLRESRRYRKLADMYWALALGEEPEDVQPSKMIAKRARHDDTCRLHITLGQISENA
jgi:hypothetical protein